MPRIRTIKPEFATDEKLARLSRDARLTFVLCITQADDDGLLPGNPRQLLAALYPLDETMTDKFLTFLLGELVNAGRLRWRGTRDGSPILEIVNWASHQKIDHKAKSLILPSLKPVGEESPRLSRESREDVASDSRSDQYQGPRTLDHSPQKTAAVKTTWMTPYCLAWKQQYGGDLPVEKSAPPLAKLRKEHGDPEVLRRWAIYLAATNGGFANAHRFASTFGQWSGAPDPAKRPARVLSAVEML